MDWRRLHPRQGSPATAGLDPTPTRSASARATPAGRCSLHRPFVLGLLCRSVRSGSNYYSQEPARQWLGKGWGRSGGRGEGGFEEAEAKDFGGEERGYIREQRRTGETLRKKPRGATRRVATGEKPSKGRLGRRGRARARARVGGTLTSRVWAGPQGVVRPRHAVEPQPPCAGSRGRSSCRLLLVLARAACSVGRPSGTRAPSHPSLSP